MKTERVNWGILGGVRFFLALCVYAVHAAPASPAWPVTELRYFGGWSAVMGFLIVSGFSIRHSIERDKSQFYARRLRRIYPTYLACLCLSLVPAIFMLSEGPTPWQFAAQLFMVQDVLATPIKAFGPSWSLASECLFYLAAPAFILLPKRGIVAVAAASFVLYAVVPVMHAHWGLLPGHIQPYRPLTLVGFWLAGWLLADKTLSPLEKTLAIVAPVAVLSLHTEDASAAILAAVLVGASAVIVAHQSDFQIPQKAKAVLGYLGELSYPLYLCHFAVLAALEPTRFANGYLAFAVSIALSVALYHLVDRRYRYMANSSAARSAISPVAVLPTEAGAPVNTRSHM